MLGLGLGLGTEANVRDGDTRGEANARGAMSYIPLSVRGGERAKRRRRAISLSRRDEHDFGVHQRAHTSSCTGQTWDICPPPGNI